MHTEVHVFTQDVKKLFPAAFKNKKILEVGSLNINGSVRQFFEKCDYLGIDLGPGPGVDKVVPIHELNEPGAFDVVISTEMLEHDKFWERSLSQMYHNLKPGGLLILTCAGPQRHEHGTTRTTPGDAPFTNDYYRNISIEDFMSVLKPEDFKTYKIKYERGQCDLCFYGIKTDE